MAFQSAPAIAGGRIGNAPDDMQAQFVSIRARHCWRANLPARDWNSLYQQFQSAPAIAGGRIYRRQVQATRLFARFNPRPPLLAGESRLVPFSAGSITAFQSAPAIAGGRILLVTVWVTNA